MSSTSSNVDVGYSTVRMILDDRGTESVPVGVVAWNSFANWYSIRLLAGGEKAKGVTGANRAFLSLATEQLQRWASEQKVPYARESSAPWESRFWDAAQQFMTTAVQIDAPRAMDPGVATEEDVESLYEALVQPRVPESRRRKRIDRVVREALGRPLARRFKGRMSVNAFGGAEEAVSRGARGGRGIVIVEGVNLAAADARRDADAAVSRIQRIREGQQADQVVSVIVGYNASPGGLNGEAHMVDWIRQKATTLVYDLVREDQEFRQVTQRELDRIGPQDSMGF